MGKLKRTIDNKIEEILKYLENDTNFIGFVNVKDCGS